MDTSTMFPFASDVSVEAIARQTNQLLEQDAELSRRIADLMWAYRELGDLIPQTVEKFWSGHYFPFLESEFELTNSFLLAQRAFYRHAFVALRSALELGLLSVYWDRADRAEKDIVAWLRSVEPTPFKAEVIKGLRTIPAVQEFERSFDLGQMINDAYTLLSDFVHIRGYEYSSQKMNRANFPRYNEGAFRQWAESFQPVVSLVAIVHLLKYPVGLQYTPLDQKFGLNGPAGGFLRPEQVDRIRATLDPGLLVVLQRISDSNQEAVEAARQIQKMPDITDEALEEQVVKLDKDLIRGRGFNSWLQDELRAREKLRELDPGSYARFEKRVKRLRKWAEEKGLLDGPVSPTIGDSA